MLGFGKKKAKQAGDNDASVTEEKEDISGEETKSSSKKGKKGGKSKGLFTKKKIFLLIILVMLGTGGYFGYTVFMGPKDGQVRYVKKELGHVGLPQEMLKFTFTQIPDLYLAILDFDSEMMIFDNEIQRIQAVGEKYPDQQKIAEKEKKVWEKSRGSLVKEFSKIEKPIKEMYVLYQVNPEQGTAKVAEKGEELVATARNALATAQEQTQKLKQDEAAAPEGLFPGLIYKLKKKFL